MVALMSTARFAKICTALLPKIPVTSQVGPAAEFRLRSPFPRLRANRFRRIVADSAGTPQKYHCRGTRSAKIMASCLRRLPCGAARIPYFESRIQFGRQENHQATRASCSSIGSTANKARAFSRSFPPIHQFSNAPERVHRPVPPHRTESGLLQESHSSRPFCFQSSRQSATNPGSVRVRLDGHHPFGSGNKRILARVHRRRARMIRLPQKTQSQPRLSTIASTTPS